MAGKRRALLVAGGLLVAVAGIAIFMLVQNLDALVKRAVETCGSETAGTTVKVGAVSIALREGRGTLRGLTVANPPGYSANPLFALDNISITFDTAALAGDVPVIDELRVGATAFRYEIDQGGESNLKAVQQNLKKARTKSAQPSGPAEEKRFRIRRLVIADGEAAFQLGRLGVGRATAKVPGVTLTDLGGARGLTPQELAQAVLNALIRNLEKSLADAGLQRPLHGKEGSRVDQAIRGLLNH